MTKFTPLGNNTIFPRINFLKQFGVRAVQRDLNGRIFLEYTGTNPPPTITEK